MDPDNPSYYEAETYIAAYHVSDYLDYDGTFAIEATPVTIDEVDTDLVTAFCGDYEERHNLTNSGVSSLCEERRRDPHADQGVKRLSPM